DTSRTACHDDVCVYAEYLSLEVLVKPAHHGKDYDQRHHPHSYPANGYHGVKGDALVPLP
ncbi:hypothetical protein MBAV_004424, partial [Candidatus Magnetobacterium bavaricum]